MHLIKLITVLILSLSATLSMATLKEKEGKPDGGKGGNGNVGNARVVKVLGSVN